jgi:hypothetical protein
MAQVIPTYYLHGLDAIPADVTEGPDEVRVVSRGLGGPSLTSSRNRILGSKQACKDALQASGDGNWPQRQ